MLLGSLIPSVKNFRRVIVNHIYGLIEHRQVPAQKHFGLAIQLDTAFYKKNMTTHYTEGVNHKDQISVSLTPWLRIVKFIDIKKIKSLLKTSIVNTRY